MTTEHGQPLTPEAVGRNLLAYLADPATEHGRPVTPGELVDHAIVCYLRSTPAVPDEIEFYRRAIAWGALRRLVVHGWPIRGVTTDAEGEPSADPWDM